MSETYATSSRAERTWALVAHLGGPAGILLSAGLFGFAVPLVIYLAKRDDSEFAGHQAKEALNFQITLFVLHVAIWIFVLATLGLGILVVWPFLIALWIGELVVGVVGGLRAYGGARFRYPLTLRMIG
jgi:uncharacterized Tic20 family protein